MLCRDIRPGQPHYLGNCRVVELDRSGLVHAKAPGCRELTTPLETVADLDVDEVLARCWPSEKVMDGDDFFGFSW